MDKELLFQLEFMNTMVCYISARLLRGLEIDAVIVGVSNRLSAIGHDEEEYIDILHRYKDIIEKLRLSLEDEDAVKDRQE